MSQLPEVGAYRHDGPLRSLEVLPVIAAHASVDPQDDYGLRSVAADLKISEVVDWPNLLVSFFMTTDVFEGVCWPGDRAKTLRGDGA